MCTDGVWWLIYIYYVSNNGELLRIQSMFRGKKKIESEKNRSYQYYYTNDECKLISSIKFNQQNKL